MEENCSFSTMSVWQKIFAEHWGGFVENYIQSTGELPPPHWEENVSRMLTCGDISEGYYEYQCQDCGATRKVGFTCKSRLCLRCFKTAIDDWLEQIKSILFEGVVHRQVVLTIPTDLRPLIMISERFMKAFVDAGALATRLLIEEWRPKKLIRPGIVAVLQFHGRSGTQNPHLHLIVSEGGVGKNGEWHKVDYFHTKKLRKKWQYCLIMALKKALRGTKYQKEWLPIVNSMLDRYKSGFECNCMPEKGEVEKLILYLCKYVSSPPISSRRIVEYDGQNVTFRYDDHRKGDTEEKLSANEFILRMIHNLPPKNFRMVRYYGIYARPVRKKARNRILGTLQQLVVQAKILARRFKPYCGSTMPHANKQAVTKLPMYCSQCGSTNLKLIRIWDKHKGFVYNSIRDGPVYYPATSFSKQKRPLYSRFVQMLLPIK